MKTRALLMGLVLSPWLMGPVKAEEPPDDTIVQETVASHGWAGLDGQYNLGGNIVKELIQAEVYIKSERLSRGDVTIYEINRKLPGTANAFDSLPGGGRAGGPNMPVSELAEYMEVTELPDPSKRGGKARFARPIPPDRVMKMKIEAGMVPTETLAGMARAQAAGSLVVGALLQDKARNSPFGSLMAAGSSEYLTVFAAATDSPGSPDCSEALSYLGSAEAAVASLKFRSAMKEVIRPWASINPMSFMTSQACFLLVGAEAFEALGKLPTETAEQIASAIETTMQSFTYGGTDSVAGRPTHKIAVEDLGGQPGSVFQPEPGGPKLTVTSASKWIDAEYFVPRKLRLEGIIEADGQSREFFLEKLEQDYRNVPDSSLYEPYRTVLRMGGMLSPEQQAEMRESQGKLDEFERRMASMSPAERALTMRMMGDKLEQWRSLANGGVVEVEIITTSIVINPDFSASGASIMPPEEPEPVTTTALSPEELRAAQLACLRERAAAAQQAQKKKRGLGSLASALSRTAAMLGDSSIGRAAGDLFAAGQSADDLVAAARDLGLTEDDAAACQQP